MIKIEKEFFFYCVDSEEVIPLDDDMVFGRKSASDYKISDSQASGKHFSIVIKSRNYYIKDLNSTNYTILNDKPIKAESLYLLSHGDRICVGNTKFIFICDDVNDFSIPDINSEEQRDISFVVGDDKVILPSKTKSVQDVIHFDKCDEGDHIKDEKNSINKEKTKIITGDKSRTLSDIENSVDGLQKTMIGLQSEIQSLRDELKEIRNKKIKKAS